MREARLEEIDERVHHHDEPTQERLEGLVPLAIPVRVGDDPHPGRGHRDEVSHARGCWNQASRRATVERMANGRLPRMSYYAKITLTVIATSALVSAAFLVRQI